MGLRTNFCIWLLRMEQAGAYISSVCPGCPSEVSIWRCWCVACLGLSFDVFPRAFFGDLGRRDEIAANDSQFQRLDFKKKTSDDALAVRPLLLTEGQHVCVVFEDTEGLRH